MTALCFFCKKDVHNAQLQRIKFRQADEFSLKAEEVSIMVLDTITTSKDLSAYASM